MSTTEPELDRLAAELSRKVREASLARSDAALTSAFDSMTSDVEAAAQMIAQRATLLASDSALPRLQSYPAEFEARIQWISSQIERVRSTLKAEPMKVRQGSLWRETRKAFSALGNDLNEVLTSSYNSLLEAFSADDRGVLDTLPPGLPGLRDYRSAIDAFEHHLDRAPDNIEEIDAAVAAGHRLKTLREKLEAESVPTEFQEQWRKLRGHGLPLDEATEDFRAWLLEGNLAASVLLSYRTS